MHSVFFQGFGVLTRCDSNFYLRLVRNFSPYFDSCTTNFNSAAAMCPRFVILETEQPPHRVLPSAHPFEAPGQAQSCSHLHRCCSLMKSGL